MTEYNILIGNIPETDKKVFFGENEKFKTFPIETRWPQLIRDLGIWKSANEAIRNGWDKDIKEGFSDEYIGKKKVRITILKITK